MTAESLEALEALDQAARAVGLCLRGAFHPGPGDDAPQGCGTLALLGPDEPRFWPLFTAAPEYSDGAPDPLDRWSARVIAPLAHRFGGQALFPSDGPPYPPFIRWAGRSGRCWPSPVGLLVQDQAGLFISYRGALALPGRLALPPLADTPCTGCARPCGTACPVGALAEGQPYDVPRCRAHVLSDDGAECRRGCLVRQACPVSQRLARLPEQSAFHMAAFLGTPIPAK